VTGRSSNPSGDLTISYKLADVESEACSLAVEYSVDGGDTWQTAMAGSGGDGTLQLASSPTGQAHTFVWANGAAIAQAHDGNVEIRLVPSDSRTGTAAIFTVDHAPQARSTTVVDKRSGTLTLAAGLTAAFRDSDDDHLEAIRIASLPAHGTLELGGAPVMVNQEIAGSQLDSLTYVPAAGYLGTDSFEWNGSDGILYAASPATMTLTVKKVKPASVLIFSANPCIQEGQTVGVGVLVTSANATDVLPTGTVTLSGDGGVVLQSLPLVKGQASGTIAGLSRGDHHLTATYSGDGAYKALVSAQPLTVHVDAATVVDLLVLYTATASQAVGNVQAAIADAVAQANQALLNSQIDVSLDLVDAAETNYTESGSYQTDLSRLQNPADGFMDEAASLRDTYGADLVCLFVGDMQNDGTIGLGYVLRDVNATDNASKGFSEVDLGEAGSPSYTLAHELGHNFGAVHDLAHSDGQGVFSDSYGYRYQGADGVWYHDIMSYDTDPTDVTIPYYSNPDISYAGKPTGQAGYSDVARTISATAPVVANYRTTKVSLVTPTKTKVSLAGPIYDHLPVTLNATIKSLAANPHTPAGTVTFLAGDAMLGTGTLSNGKASWTGTVPVSAGGAMPAIRALYRADDYFGDSLSGLAPSALSLGVPEHSAVGTVVGSAAAAASPGHEYTYAITGGNAAGGFAIDPATGAISVANAAVLDYEQQPTYALQVTATDGPVSVVTSSTTMTVNLIDVNEPPTNVTLSNAAVVDGRAAGTLVGLLYGQDPDRGDSLGYLLAGADKAFFTIDGNALKTAAVFDAAVRSSYSIKVKVVDQGGLWITKPFTITVTKDQAPTNLALSNATIAEHLPAGTKVGLLSACDPDPGESLTYGLVPGFGDNSLFMITNSKLKAMARFDYSTKSSYQIEVKVRDLSGLKARQTFTITVTPAAGAALVPAAAAQLAPEALAGTPGNDAVLGRENGSLLA
jgi:hypothetical protein